MKISTLKQNLTEVEELKFRLPNGYIVPLHFHITEVGKSTRHFIDCGGTVRNTAVASLQIWDANDYEHRLHPSKLKKIIEKSEEILDLEDLEVEFQFQLDTVGLYGVEFDGEYFNLTATMTDCLAKHSCGAPVSKQKLRLSNLTKETSPAAKCC